jgi:hypothetical protein
MASQGIEIEKKYDVGDDATVPALEELPGVARVGTPRSAVLEAVYFDTDQHTLASRRITLRRRTGGTDAGWHLKLPPEATTETEPQQRREVHAPLGQPGVVPDSLLARVQAYLRGDEVRPVVRLETRRTTHALYGEDGVHLADLADDQVEATRLHMGMWRNNRSAGANGSLNSSMADRTCLPLPRNSSPRRAPARPATHPSWPVPSAVIRPVPQPRRSGKARRHSLPARRPRQPPSLPSMWRSNCAGSSPRTPRSGWRNLRASTT